MRIAAEKRTATRGLRLAGTVTAAAVALTLGVLAPRAGAVTINPGDILVVDPIVDDAVIRVDPDTGARTAVSDNTINTGTDFFVEPRGIALDQNGNVLVTDLEASGGSGALIRVNPATGQQALVSDNAINTGTDLFEDPIGVAVEDDGDILVTDDRPPTNDAVIRVDPTTGQQTLVSDNTVNTGTDLFSLLSGIVVEPSGQILVTDLDSLSPHSGGGALIRVDPDSGQQTAVSSNTIDTSDPCSGFSCFSEPSGVAIESDGQILVADYDAELTGAIIRIASADGQHELVSNNAVNTGTDLFNDPRELALDAAGRVLVADSGSGVIRVDPATGQQASVATGVAGFQPFDILVVPGGFVPPPPPPPPGGGGPPGVGTGPAPGNPVPARPKRCKKGQKLKQGKCVKKKRKRRR